MKIMSKLFGKEPDAHKDICCFCGKVLTPKLTYRQPQGKCCENCYRERNPSKFCARCKSDGQGQLYRWDGKNYCGLCYFSITMSQQCPICKGKMIEKEYLPAIHKYICKSCKEKIVDIKINTSGDYVVVRLEFNQEIKIRNINAHVKT